MPKLRLALAQTNPVVGDLSGNSAQIIKAVRKAAAEGADVVLFGEMSLAGYPIEDLATRPSFIDEAARTLDQLCKELDKPETSKIAVIVGLPTRAEQTNGWAIAHNSAVVIRAGKVIGQYNKHHLPNYSVFDEYRNFVPGNELLTFEHFGFNLSIVICEDIWQSGGPVAEIEQNLTDLTMVLNGSPFEVDKGDRRLDLVQKLARDQNTAVAYVNLVGGQDDLVFDGDSLFVTADAKLVERLPKFENDIRLVDFEGKHRATAVAPTDESQASQEWQIWNALVLGLRDYVNKNGFKSVVLGLSGGIDSAVCAAIAVDAIGGNRVFGVSMPSDFSSEHSKSDAFDLAERLSVNIRTEAIANMVDAFETQLKLEGLAIENLQARVRGVILMALSNQEGHLTLTTGNKTELAVGYSTIYGDSVGGYAPLKDVEKTLVWKLANWRNSHARELGLVEPIPENSITKPPSAELRPGQLDQDSLPDYEILDAILDLYVEQRAGTNEILEAGFEASEVNRVIGLVERAEWKRRQGAIGPKITGMAFGRDRRLPITNKYKG